MSDLKAQESQESERFSKLAVADWTIGLEEDDQAVVISADESVVPEKPQIIVARLGDEVIRMSPNCTDEEIQKIIAAHNEEAGN